MAILNPDPTEKPRIDLAGPQGNAFALLGLADDYGKSLAWTKEQRAAVSADMKSGDYDHLIQVFDRHFGELVDLVLPPPPVGPSSRKRAP